MGRLAPLCVSGYPDDSERIYYPDRSRGIEGFSRVTIKWDPYQPNMYRWKPHQEYEVKYPGTYQLETPQGYCLLYQPIVRVNMYAFMDYLKQNIYSKTIDYPRRVEDPVTHRITWDYSFDVEDTPDRTNSMFPEPPVDVPDPKAGDDVTVLEPDIIELPQCWAKSELHIQTPSDGPLHPIGIYEGVLNVVGIDFLNHFSSEGVDVVFDGLPYRKPELPAGWVHWNPSAESTEGLWHGFHCEIFSETVMPNDPSFSLADDEDVVVAPGTGLVSVYADDGDIVCDMHWNPSTSPAWTVHVDHAYVHNGYINTHGTRAELRICDRSDRNTVATYVPIDQRGVCTLLFSPQKIKLD